jgi:hypothetical protein
LAERTQLQPTSRWRIVLAFAALGAVSGVLSWLASQYVQVETLRMPFSSRLVAGPLHPGIVFGIFVAGGCWWFGRAKPHKLLALKLFGVVAITTAAWIAAWIAVLAAGARLDFVPQALGEPVCFALGGLTGALGTCLAVALAAPAFRRPSRWLLTLVAATLAGGFTPLYSWLHAFGTLALFVLWQAAVMAAIAHVLAGAQSPPR